MSDHACNCGADTCKSKCGSRQGKAREFHLVSPFKLLCLRSTSEIELWIALIPPSKLPATGDDAPVRRDGPKGVGLSVGLLWGVSVQLLARGLSRLVGSDLFAGRGDGRLAGAGALALALIAFGFGECVRRGLESSRRFVVLLGVALAALGLASAPGTVRDLERGFAWSAVPTAILLTVAPLMAFWMHSARSRAWFEEVSHSEARRRHGGPWVAILAAIAVVSGLVVAYAEARHR